jgi:hypothetical protein
MASQPISVGQLQARQYEHDMVAHRAVLLLPLGRRLTRFVLHLSKYQGKLITGPSGGSKDLRRRLITDSMIVILSAGNALNFSLSDSRASLNPRRDQPSDTDAKKLLAHYVSTVGYMAEACEAMDHGEDYPVADVLKKGVRALFSITAALAALEGVELQLTIPERWAEVEHASSYAADKMTRDVDNKLSAVA